VQPPYICMKNRCCAYKNASIGKSKHKRVIHPFVASRLIAKYWNPPPNINMEGNAIIVISVHHLRFAMKMEIFSNFSFFRILGLVAVATIVVVNCQLNGQVIKFKLSAMYATNYKKKKKFTQKDHFMGLIICLFSEIYQFAIMAKQAIHS